MLQSGEIIGGTYRLERQLGKGGMGEVWLARHTLLDENRAIKIVLGEIATNAELRDRFIRGEARNSLRLERHPNIVRVYELGQHDGMPYMVMEYVEGLTLRQILTQRKTLPPRETFFFLDQIAKALDLAHRQGMIHRDIKPANVLVEPNGRAKLSDFGLTKNLETSQDDSLTTTGQYMGTPAYVSPEQVEGHADQRSDIYSLGAMIYEMLTGRPPFVGVATSVIVQHVTTAPPALRNFNPAIPPQIQEVVLRALAKKPQERYQTAMEFAGAFYRALQQTGEIPTTTGSQPLTNGPQTAATPHVSYSPPLNQQNIEATTPIGLEQPTIPTGNTPPQAIAQTGNTPPTGSGSIAATNVPSNPPGEPSQPKPSSKGLPLKIILPVAALMLIVIGAVVTFLIVSGSSNNPVAGQVITPGPKITPTFTLPNKTADPVIFGNPINQVNALDLSPDGKIIAAGYDNNIIRLWNAENGQELSNLFGHQQAVTGVDFSSDGKQLVSCSADNTLRLWTIPDGKLIRTFDGHTAQVNSCHFINNDTAILSLSEDKTRKLWSVATNDPPVSVTVENEQLNRGNLFSPDGSIVVSLKEDYSLVFNDTTKNSEIDTINFFGSGVQSGAFNPKNTNQIAICLDDGTIRLWDLKTKAQTIKLNLSLYGVLTMTYASDGKTLVIGTDQGKIIVVDLDAGKIFSQAYVQERGINRIIFLPGDKRIISSSRDNTIHITNLEGLKQDKIFSTPSLPSFALAVSEDGKLAAYTKTRKIEVFDLTKGAVKYTLEGHDTLVRNVAFSHDGTKLASVDNENELFIWDMKTGSKSAEDKPNYSFKGLAFSPDDKFLAVGSQNHIYLYNTANFPQKRDLKEDNTEANIGDLVFLDNKTLLTGWYDGRILVWSPGNGDKPTKTLAKYDKPVMNLAISPNKKVLAVGILNGLIYLLDPNSGTEKLQLKTETYSFGSLTFDHESNRLAAALSLGEIWIWQAGGKADQQPVKLKGHTDSVGGFQFIYDDKYGFSASADGTTRLYKL